MSFDQEPRNWRNVANVTHEDGKTCPHLKPFEKTCEQFYDCSWILCSCCKMNSGNPDRASYIQSCKDRLIKEEQSMNWKAHADLHAMYNIPDTKTKETAMNETETPLYDLTKIGPVLSLTPVVVEVSDNANFNDLISGILITITAYNNVTRFWVQRMDNICCYYRFCRHPFPALTPRIVHMTAQDIACLPRGTAFVRKNFGANEYYYNACIWRNESGDIFIDGVEIACYSGYILPNETELRPFTKVEE